MNTESFLSKKNKIAVVGVSINHEKWGWKIYKKLKSLGFHVYPINPKYDKIGNDTCYKNLFSLPEKVDVVITIVKPEITKKVVAECKKIGINKVWMQPGSESNDAVRFCRENNIDVVFNACFVVNGLKENFEGGG